MGWDVLAIHPICHSTVSWDRVSEILNVECSLESRGKETTEWSDQGCKSRHDEGVDLEGSVVECWGGKTELKISQAL